MIVVILLSSVVVGAQQPKKPVAKVVPVTTPAVQRPKLPIEYVHERNLGAKTDYNQSSQYGDMSYSKYCIPNGSHMPSIEEWVGVFPLNGVLSFEEDDVVLDNYEVVDIAGEMHTFESDYQRDGLTCYALRFKGDTNEYLCAYRYKRVGRFVTNSYDSGVEVQVIYLGPSFNGSLDDIANELYWTKNKSKAIRRYFPIPGFRRKDYPGMTDSMGTQAYYWSTQANIVLQINIEGVSSGKLAPVFQSVARPFYNK